jgi:GT2 family glycosyltransferase
VPSVIIPARNGFEATSICLGTVLYSMSRLNLNCEFILVDDASAESEHILDAFRQHRANARGHETKIIRSRKHQHYTGVFSIGLHFAKRDVVFFISNDMMVTPTFIQDLLLVSSLSRDFGIVRGTSNYTDSHPEHRVEPKERPKEYRDVDNFSRSVFNSIGCGYVEDRILSGDAILLKRELIDRIGVLDLRFFGYFGDIDYGMRAHLAGFKLICAKGAWLFHEGGGHVKNEMARQSINLEQARDRRMALVEKAYAEFRQKWDPTLPSTWSVGEHTVTVDFVHVARSNAQRVALKYPFPDSVLNDIELI